MARNKRASRKLTVHSRLRVLRGDEIAVGPGRIELLELILETGSLTAAAERMGISYMRAWELVKSTNRAFREPLVEAVRGGKSGGGAELTREGRKVIALYRRMERQSQKAVQPSWDILRKLLRT